MLHNTPNTLAQQKRALRRKRPYLILITLAAALLALMPLMRAAAGGTAVTAAAPPSPARLEINTVPLGSRPAGYTQVNGQVFFSAWDDDNGKELWVSDGTAGDAAGQRHQPRPRLQRPQPANRPGQQPAVRRRRWRQRR